MNSSEEERFRLTPSLAAKRLREVHGIDRTPDAIRFWGRMGKLPTIELANGQRLYRASDIDALGARLAAEEHHADVA